MSTTDYQNEQVPQPLADGIKTALARRGGCFLLKRVKVDNKGNKADRVLALVPCRGYIFSVRIPTKVELTFHFFEIQGIISMKPNQVLIETEKVVLSLTTASSNDADDIIFNIGLAIKKILPGLFSSHFLRRLTIDPPDRESRQLEEWQRQSNAEQGSCGGFSQIYACVCDQLNLPFRDEVQWDVDTIYFTHELQDLNLDDFSHLDSRDLVPIVATLEYSQWFTKLLCKDTKLNGDICEHIIRVIRNSSKLTALELEGASLKPEFMQKLAVALFDNHQSVLQSISLAGSAMDDKGVISFSSQLHHLIKGLYNLNLSRTALTLRGANSLCQALMGSEQIKATLTHLDLSGNILRADESSKLYAFLAQPNALINLNLSGTECLLETMFGALLRGCSQHLSHLNLSRNIFSNRKSRDILPSFSQFFNHSMALEKFSLSGTRLPPAAVREILLAVSSNQHLSSVSLDISSCELKSAGAKALIYCLEDVRNITSLDISDNGLDVEVANVIQALSKNRTIRHVYIGRNFSNVRPKAISTVMESIVLMIQDEEFWLKSLSLADSRLKTAAVIVASAICGAATLSHLDLSGNGMGDSGARMLAKALAVNTTLRTVAWDRNGTTAQGLYDVACALERNYTLHSMPIPVHDVSLAIKNQPEKTEAALHKIETLLLRNQGRGNASPERILRLQHCIAHDTTQQLVDQLCVKVQDQLRLLQNGPNADSTQRRVANTLLSQAKNTRVLLLALYKCSEEFWDSRNSINPVIEKLDGAASNVGQAIDSQLQVMVEAMHTTMGNLCSSLITDEGCTEVWHETGVGINMLALPRGFVQKVLVEQAGSELLNQIGEVRLDISLKLTNQAVDRMLELLSQMQRQLGKQLEKQGQIMAATPEEDFASDGLSKALPSFRRSQTRSRKMRPLSVDFVDAGTEKVSAKGKTGSNRQAKDFGVGESVDPLVLPSEEDRQLEHITRSRPARPGRPGRPQHKTPPEQNKDQSGIDEHVDEGVDDFFSKKILPPEHRNRPVEKAAKREDAPLTRLLKSNFLNILLHKRKRGDREQSQSHSSTNNNVVPPSNQSPEQYRPIQKTATWQESHDDADVLEEVPVAAEGEAIPMGASVARNEERSKPETWRMFGVPVMPCLVSNDQLCSRRHKNEVQAISDGNTTSESQDEPSDKKKASLHRKEAMVVSHKRTLPSARISLTSSKQPNFQDSIAPDKEGGSEMDPHKEVLPLPPQKSEPPVPFQVDAINPDPSNLLSVAEKETPEPVYSMLQQKCQRPTSLIVQGEWGNISRNRIPSKKKMAQSMKRRSLDQLLDL